MCDVLEVTEVGPQLFLRPVCWLVACCWGLGSLPKWASTGIPAAAIASGTLESQCVGQVRDAGLHPFSLPHNLPAEKRELEGPGMLLKQPHSSLCHRLEDGDPPPRELHTRGQNLREEERKAQALSPPNTRQGFLRGPQGGDAEDIPQKTTPEDKQTYIPEPPSGAKAKAEQEPQPQPDLDH